MILDQAGICVADAADCAKLFESTKTNPATPPKPVLTCNKDVQCCPVGSQEPESWHKGAKLNPLETVKAYRALAIEKKLFLESKAFDRIFMQIGLMSYLVLSVGSNTDTLLNGDVNGLIILFLAMELAFIFFLIAPKLAPARFFSFIKYYTLLMPILFTRLLFVTEMSLFWYGRLACVGINLLALPIFYRYFIKVRSARKTALDEILGMKS